jgi:xanthine dehydrogenase YagR molybdenum-binding subunit
VTSVATERAIGAPHERVEGHLKVAGRANYAAEHNPEGVVHAVVVQSTIAKGRITRVGELEGVLAVISHANADRINAPDDKELHVLQDPDVHYRGQIVAVVVAETLEAARAGADALEVVYAPARHEVVLTPESSSYAPDGVNGGYPTDSIIGDAEAALRDADTVVDQTYTTPVLHNNAMEPHACVAHWREGRLVVNESSQGVWAMRGALAEVFGLEADDVSVHSPHVGGGFGSKGTMRPHTVVAALAAKQLERPVKLVTTRRQMFAFTGYRTPTIQRVRLGADSGGRITAVSHEALSQSSQLKEFTEQTTTPTRVMYAGEHRRTTHRLARLDVATPSWMRAPGETPGMFGLESAMDELAVALDMDPVELRIRNDPPRHPESGKEWSSRGLVACLREGAERFGWAGRHDLPEGRGYGVAASMYPAYRAPGWAHAQRESDGSVTVRIAAADIGTGARTVLTQIAADACGLPFDQVRVELGSSDFPRAGVAGGSMGTASWGSAVHGACRRLVDEDATEASYDTREDIDALEDYARHAFGAQFAAVSVDSVTGEVTVDRLLGVFAAGRIINPRTARSQLIGGMTMGLGMALMEETVVDAEFGDFLSTDLASYHVPVNADVRDIDATWVDEDDPHLNPMGSKGIGEIGITGTAAAIANAVFAATGVRVRRLPIHVEALI